MSGFNRYPEEYIVPLDIEEVSTTFTIDVMNTGRIRVTDINGGVEYCSNISELSKTISSIRRGIKSDILSNVMPRILESGQWTFPSKTTPIGKMPNRGNCVYFAYDPQHTHVIKIGQTSSLRNRLKGLREQGTHRNYIALAYFMTDHHKLLEQALLNHFSEHLHSGAEYFHTAPIYDWLKGVYQEVMK